MWAQLITMHLKPGQDDRMNEMLEQLRAAEQEGSGIVRHLVMRDDKDSSRFLMLAVFESEEQARERENDPRRMDGLKLMRETMAEIIDGPPEFVDLTVFSETTY